MLTIAIKTRQTKLMTETIITGLKHVGFEPHTSVTTANILNAYFILGTVVSSV